MDGWVWTERVTDTKRSFTVKKGWAESTVSDTLKRRRVQDERTLFSDTNQGRGDAQDVGKSEEFVLHCRRD